MSSAEDKPSDCPCRRYPLPASLVVPTVVTGTVVVALLVSWLVLRERLGLFQLAGAGLIVAGILVMFLGRGAARA